MCDLKRGIGAILYAAVVATAWGSRADAQGASVSLADRVKSEYQLTGPGHCDGKAWTDIAADKGFAALSSRNRAITYLNLAACVGGARRHEWRVLASKEADTLPLAWGLLFLEAVDAKDTAEAFADLDADLAAAKRTGEPFSMSNLRGVYVFYRRLEDEDRFRLFKILDEANWAPVETADDVSEFWGDYAALLIGAGDQAGAIRQLKKVTAARALFALSLDKRFYGLRRSEPQLFDFEKLGAADVERLANLYKESSNDNAIYEIIEALSAVGRYDVAVAVADEALKSSKLVDEDGHDYRNWVEDRRAAALLDMGRFDDAIAGERRAASRQERGHANASQILNLGQMLLDVGRFEEALDAIKTIETQGVASPAGLAYAAQIKVCAYGGLGRKEDQRRALAGAAEVLGKNRSARLEAVLCADDIPAAVKLMVDWLDEPQSRRHALVELCPAPEMTVGAYRAVLSRRFDKVRHDSAVVAAIAKAGRTEALSKVGADWPYYP
jgi:tetratricopeptide (TPR) repeat protein